MLRKVVWIAVIGSFLVNLNVALAANHNEFVSKFSQAQHLAKAGKTAQAIALYQSIIAANPQRPEAYNNLAALYLAQKKTKLAKQILEKGLRAHKGYGALYENLTAINVAMARDAYSKALQIDLKPAGISIAAMTISDKPKSLPVQKKRIETSTAIPAKDKAKIKKDIEVKKPEEKKPTNMVSSTALTKTLQAWSVAWSAQAVDMYLSFYHQQYKPSNGLSYKGWKQSRRIRLKKPKWIKVSLSDFDIKQQSPRQAVVNFKQKYQSNSFSDISTKQVVLLYTDDGWRIYREKSL